MIGKDFRVSVRVKACIGGHDWCKGGKTANIRPGMVLIALNDTNVDHSLLRVTDQRGVGSLSLRPLAALMQQRPIRVLFLDPFRLAVSFRQYLQRVTLNAKFYLLPWSQQKHLIYEFCGTATADEQPCEFSEYAGLALPVH